MSRDSHYRSHSFLGSAREESLPRSFLTVLVPTVAVLGAEALSYAGHDVYATGGYLVLLPAFVVAYQWFEGRQPVLGAFALVAGFRLVALGMPPVFESDLSWVLAVYGAVLVGLAGYVGVEGWRELNPVDRDRRYLLVVPAGLVLAAILAGVEYRVLEPDALVASDSAVNVLAVAVVMVGAVALVEEVLFRGVLQRVVQDRLGRWAGVVLASVVYGATFSAYATPASLLAAGAVGLVLGVVYELTDDLALTVLVHGTANVLLFGVFPFSGLPV